MERNIPHIKDIFSSSSRKKSVGDTQDLCLYDKSPRSRRKFKNSEPTPDYFDFDAQDNKNASPRKRNDKSITGKENQKSSKAPEETRLIPEGRNGNNRNNHNTYSSKTLTERDIRHLERHLSMKKTIRKQISRNLAQAFVDNPNLFEPDVPKPENPKPEYGVTMTRAKIAKSEQNVLDMLKVSIEERDSGHSSPTNEVLRREDDEYGEDFDNINEPKGWDTKHRSSETKLLADDRTKTQHKDYGSDKKSSIWKMFSVRSKAKR